jgi:hypothetical protein
MSDHTHVNGTKRRAIQERVVAPVRNPSASCSNQASFGGAVRSGATPAEPPTGSENEKVLPQRRQRAMWVATFMSSIAIVDRHSAQTESISREGCHRVSCGSNTSGPPAHSSGKLILSIISAQDLSPGRSARRVIESRALRITSLGWMAGQDCSRC